MALVDSDLFMIFTKRAVFIVATAEKKMRNKTGSMLIRLGEVTWYSTIVKGHAHVLYWILSSTDDGDDLRSIIEQFNCSSTVDLDDQLNNNDQSDQIL